MCFKDFSSIFKTGKGATQNTKPKKDAKQPNGHYGVFVHVHEDGGAWPLDKGASFGKKKHRVPRQNTVASG